MGKQELDNLVRIRKLKPEAPSRQEFDGSDYQSTHVIVYAGDDPVGTQRIRWFKDFAKLELTAFRDGPTRRARMRRPTTPRHAAS